MIRRRLAAGNWKMNGLSTDLSKLDELIANHPEPACEVLICPPATLLEPMRRLTAGSAIALGGQNCHAEVTGAHTGEVSAQMLADAGAEFVILGHSERRAAHGESDSLVQAKATTAYAAGLVSVICVGETLDQRERGETLQIVGSQLSGSLPANTNGRSVVVAYEPVWAIGTGRVPTMGQIAEVHDYMRSQLMDRFGSDADGVRLLYGGSVNPSNAKEIFSVANVDGALVGGASLNPADFGAIIKALESRF